MGVSIEYKEDNFGKTVILRRRMDKRNALFSFLFFIVFFYPFIRSYRNILAQDISQFYPIVPSLLFFFLFLIVLRSMRLEIIRDMSDGSTVVVRKTLKTAKDVFYKEEKPAMRLSDLPGFGYITGNKKLLSVISESKEVFLSPFIASGVPGRKASFQLGYNNKSSLWTFSENEANDIAGFLGLNIVSGVDNKETVGEKTSKGELKPVEVVSTIVWGLVGFFVGFFNMIISFVMFDEVGFSEMTSFAAAMIIFFASMILVVKIGNKITCRKDPFAMS